MNRNYCLLLFVMFITISQALVFQDIFSMNGSDSDDEWLIPVQEENEEQRSYKEIFEQFDIKFREFCERNTPSYDVIRIYFDLFWQYYYWTLVDQEGKKQRVYFKEIQKFVEFFSAQTRNIVIKTDNKKQVKNVITRFFNPLAVSNDVELYNSICNKFRHNFTYDDPTQNSLINPLAELHADLDSSLISQQVENKIINPFCKFKNLDKISVLSTMRVVERGISASSAINSRNICNATLYKIRDVLKTRNDTEKNAKKNRPYTRTAICGLATISLAGFGLWAFYKNSPYLNNIYKKTALIVATGIGAFLTVNSVRKNNQHTTNNIYVPTHADIADIVARGSSIDCWFDDKKEGTIKSKGITGFYTELRYLK